MREEEDDDVRGGPGWFATLVGAALLLAAGFAVGVVVGAVREEPAMLLQYVTGQTASLPAPASAPSPAAPPPSAPAPPESNPPVEAAAPPARQAAAAPPARAPEAAPPARSPAAVPPAPQAVIAPARPGAPPVASSSPAGARFAVQVGAFAQSGEAERLEAELRSKGLPVYVQPATGARESRWRVRVGPLASRAEADKVAARLKAQDKLPVWILEESGT